MTTFQLVWIIPWFYHAVHGLWRIKELLENKGSKCSDRVHVFRIRHTSPSPLFYLFSVLATAEPRLGGISVTPVVNNPGQDGLISGNAFFRVLTGGFDSIYKYRPTGIL